jgi:hypothetical protein
VCVYTSTIVVSPDPLSPTPTSSGLKTPESTEEDPDDREPVDEGDIQMQCSSDQLYNTGVGAVTKNYLLELRSVCGTA